MNEKRGEFISAARRIVTLGLLGYISLTPSFNDGTPVQSDPIAAIEKAEGEKRELKQLKKDVNRIRKLGAEEIKQLDGNALLEQGAQIQDTALSLAAKSGISAEEAKDMLLGSAASETLAARNVTFEPDSTVCLNGTAQFNNSGELVSANFPLGYLDSEPEKPPVPAGIPVTNPGNRVIS
ncbi:MAG TPA: hypothetical protein VFX86_00240 [Candidatus Saccharimonadales bacterium]|nr:hypothetical protein [Candidatus Saccharimonadales bacterium]